MTDPKPHPTNPPTAKQLSYLRDLALSRGQSFAYPSSFEEADREIKRLRRERRTPAVDRRRERREVSAAMQERGDAARVRSHEVGGYGASARWR